MSLTASPYSRYLLVVLLLACRLAYGADLVRERAYVDDPTAALRLDEVRQMPATPFAGVLSRGFTRSATWIRLRVDGLPGADASGQLVVRIRPVYLDRVELFDPLDTSGRPRVAGDRVPWDDGEFKSLNHGFLIPASTRPRDIWLRLTTTSSSFIHVEVLTPDEAQQANRLQEMLYGLMMGVLLLYVVWALLQWLLRRERLMAVFMFSQFMAVIYAATYVGYNRLLLSGLLDNALIEMLANYTYCSYVGAGFLFHVFLLREFCPARPVLWTIGLLTAFAWLAEMLMLAFGRVQPAMQTNIVVVSAAPIIFFLTALGCRAWREAGEQERPPIPNGRWSASTG